MGLSLNRTYTQYGIPKWQKPPSLYQGGFKLVLTHLLTTEVVADGTPVYVDEAARTATVLRTAKAQAIATDSAVAYKVEKGHHLAVGDYFAKTVGSKAYAITAIDSTTSTDYDEITIGTTLGAAVAVGDAFFVSSAQGASAAALPVTPNGLVYQQTTVETGASVAVAYAGQVYKRRIPAMDATALAALSRFLFSNSY